MHDFEFKAGELVCEKVKVSSIAQRVGTPFYLYSYKTLADHFLKIQRAFAKVNPIICFAMKSNGNLSVIKALVDLGAGIDIVSVGELKKLCWPVRTRRRSSLLPSERLRKKLLLRLKQAFYCLMLSLSRN